MSRVIVPVAAGCEESEVVVVVDLLRRAGLDVVMASVDGTPTVVGSHGIGLACDATIDECDFTTADAIVLPGGPGTPALRESERLTRALAAHHEAGKLIGAICAAPTVLESLGILSGRRATCHPAHAAEMTSCQFVHDAVVADGRVITSRGVGTTIPFAAALIAELAGRKVAEEVLDRIVFPVSGM